MMVQGRGKGHAPQEGERCLGTEGCLGGRTPELSGWSLRCLMLFSSKNPPMARKWRSFCWNTVPVRGCRPPLAQITLNFAGG